MGETAADRAGKTVSDASGKQRPSIAAGYRATSGSTDMHPVATGRRRHEFAAVGHLMCFFRRNLPLFRCLYAGDSGCQ